jgi:hypothetical protein
MPGAPGLPTWMSYKRQLQLLPPLSTARDSFGGKRIPRLPPVEGGETPPGRICWGTVGDLPTPEPLPTVNFTVGGEQWREWGRQSEPVRIENPDDPSQYIMDNRPKTIDFDKKTGATSAPNTAAAPLPGMSNYVNTDSFVDSLGETRTKVRMHYVTQS